MPGKRRIFISSTMQDLENERHELVAALSEANFEPVNAEAMLPNSDSSWGRISDEIETCHVFVLLSGVRYGWIPTSGALSKLDVSVTHAEYLKARELGLFELRADTIAKLDRAERRHESDVEPDANEK